MNRSIILSLTLIIILSVSPTILWAGEKVTAISSDDNKTEQKNKLNLPKNWEIGIGMERFVASHTSYEFGMNEPPWTKPLSRLEFPVNTWWLNFDARRTCPRWSIGGRAGFSVNRNSNNWMIDSDWDSVGNQDFLTNYSKNYCDVRNAFLFRGDVDVNISDWLKLPPSLEIRPLFVFQFQRYSLMMHDGIQWNYVKDPKSAVTPLAQELLGDCVSFRQDWWLYMIGLRGSYNLKLSKYMTVKMKGEADWGPALGFNEDHHLQREGDRFTRDNTLGNALYFLTGVDMTISKTITIGIGVDYLWIRTTGEHWLYNAPEGDDVRSSDDVKAWSDQLGLIARIAYAF